MESGGNKYDTQLTRSEKIKDQEFTHNMYKIAVEVTFTKMNTKRGIKMHSEK